MARRVRRGGRAPAEGPLYPTSEVMRRSGLSRQALYQYTAMGLLEQVDTTRSGQRLYPEGVFRRLEIIRELKDTGYPLQEIRSIFFARKRGALGGA